MQMIAAVITFCERERIIGCTKCLVEIDTAVALVVGADPVIDGTAQLLTERCVGAPAVNRQKGSEIDAVMKLSGFLDIPFQTIDQFGGSRQIAHGTERIDVGSDRMDDIVDALLDFRGKNGCFP